MELQRTNRNAVGTWRRKLVNDNFTEYMKLSISYRKRGQKKNPKPKTRLKNKQKERETARSSLHNYAEIWPKLNVVLLLYVGRGERIEKDWLF